MSPGFQDEEQLLERVRSGDEEAWKILYDRYIAKLKAVVTFEIINRNVLGRIEPGDVCQEAFLKAFLHAEKVTHFFGFLRKTAVRVVANEARALQAKKRRPPEGALANPDYDQKMQPGAIILETEKSEFIRQKLEEIRSDCHELLILYYYQDLSHRDIAERLGVSNAVSRQRLKQCRKFLGQRMKRDPRYNSIFEH